MSMVLQEPEQLTFQDFVNRVGIQAVLYPDESMLLSVLVWELRVSAVTPMMAACYFPGVCDACPCHVRQSQAASLK